MSGGSTYRRPLAVRAELIQHLLLILDQGGELLVGETPLAVVLKFFECANDGIDLCILRING